MRKEGETKAQSFNRELFKLIDDYFEEKMELKEASYNKFKDIAERESDY